jgi:hypothetical protein
MNKDGSFMPRKTFWAGLLCVRMTLRDVFYVSYVLPAKILQPLVPEALRLAVRGDGAAFVSLVALRSTQVRLTSFPFIRFNYNQLNIRTYVIDPVSGQPAVYFIRSGVTSHLISLAAGTLGIPWEFIKFAINFAGSKEIRSSKISGDFEGRFALKLHSAENSSQAPFFFQDRKEAVDFLIRPLIGFSGNSRRLARFTIQHPEVQPESWALEELDCPILNKLVPVESTGNPHSVFYLPVADFSIYMPPERIKKKE